MQITLTAVAGPHTGQTFTFAEHDMFLVGRSKNAHFQLPRKDRYFSRIHFMVEVNPPRCRILDMGSRNGTHVNGQRIESTELQDGDEIKAGHTVLRVTFQRLGETSAPPGEATASWSGDGATAGTEPAPAPPEVAAPAEDPPLATPVGEALPRPASTQSWNLVGSHCPACDGLLEEPGQLCAACQQLAAGRPQLIPGYLVVRDLGRGAMGVVCLAVRVEDNTRVAIKTIVPAMAGSPTQVQRFLREATILRQLQHPHIVSFRDMGEANGQLYFVMDHIKGIDARQLLVKHGRLDMRLAIRIMCQVLQGLAHAHGLGFVHRDIKPANIMVAEENSKRVAKLADFGLARVYHASKMSGLTLTGDVGGTLPYMAPEQITQYREVKPAADQYSTAATLYHLLTGKYVYDLPPQTHECFLKILYESPVPLRQRSPDLPEALDRVLQRALARPPEERYPDVDTFRRALIPFGR